MLKFEKEKKLHKVKTLYFFMADTFVNKKNKVSNVLVNFEKKVIWLTFLENGPFRGIAPMDKARSYNFETF